ncbi:longitudinals lacking protein, isoforms H/M/V-like isoform X2 [Homarus americanus]|uniref:longitudinals lacking protein, isoforms H/M/V-like isoform X2 n=1 Tax=Homarus americanus TaxID=6706 RepID=UPI001C43E870|nr:longitudinals lacking protein, isoforms H/M/V-like isoform X2 [Homarus americanus]
MGTFQKFCLRWNNHTTNLLGTLGHILTSEQHSDVTLCCQGEVWRLHKLVLCASSSHFEKLLGALPPGNSPIVVLDGPHPQDVASLIHFIYHGEVNVDQENLASLLRTAESLKIKGLAEVSSVTSGGEHKSHCDGESQRHHNRGRSRPGSCHSAPVYTLGNEYPVGMYGLVPQSISPHTQVPDPLERDPSPLNLSFSGSLKNIHDETPQERQERRNRLDDLLYAATERSKKEERREARREAREAALREAAAIREASVMLTQDQALLPPVAKRARTTDSSRNTTLPAHPAFHIPLMNLTLPSNASTSLVTSQSISSTQTSHPPEAIPLTENAAVILQKQDVQQEQINNHQEVEANTRKSPVKTENIEVSSDITIMEDVAVNSDESDTQSAPETPSDVSSAPTSQGITPTTTTTATQVPSSAVLDEVNSASSCRAPVVANNTINCTNGPSVTPPSEPSEEKVTPYFHSILQQVAEGGSGGEQASSNAQRVTINMRTFKSCKCYSSAG